LLVYILLITLMAALSSPVHAADPTPKITVGTQEVGLSAGYLLPHRLTQDHTTK
jgi:lipid A 3-O-deacylase